MAYIMRIFRFKFTNHEEKFERDENESGGFEQNPLFIWQFRPKECQRFS